LVAGSRVLEKSQHIFIKANRDGLFRNWQDYSGIFPEFITRDWCGVRVSGYSLFDLLVI